MAAARKRTAAQMAKLMGVKATSPQVKQAMTRQRDGTAPKKRTTTRKKRK